MVELAGGAQVDDGAQTEWTQHVEVFVGQTPESVGAEDRAPLHGAAVARLVAAEVTEVVDTRQVDAAGELICHHEFHRTGEPCRSVDCRMTRT